MLINPEMESNLSPNLNPYCRLAGEKLKLKAEWLNGFLPVRRNLPGRGEYGQRRDGGGFRAQHLRAERNRLPAGGDGAAPLVIRPATLRAEKDGDVVGAGAGRGHSFEQWRGDVFVQKIAAGSLFGKTDLEADRRQNLWNVDAAGLLAALAGDPLPAFGAFVGGLEKAFLAARRFDGENALHADLRGFLDDPLEAVELDERGAEQEVDWRRRRLDRFENAEYHPLAAGLGDLGEVRGAVVGDFKTLAGLDAQDSREMAGCLAAEFGCAVMDGIDEESASCQATIVGGLGLTAFDAEAQRRGDRTQRKAKGKKQKAPIRRLAFPRELMIALLRGILVEKHPNQAIVEAGGVGYDVNIPVSTFTKLPDPGAEVRLYIHTHVREDALSLYGFLSQDEKALFEKLIGVSGIGPTLAVKVLSGLSAADLVNFIRRGEVDRLVRVPGVGKKTAERMVLELRDKLPAVTGAEPATPSAEALSPVDQDVLSALLNLGCARPQAEAAVRKAKAPGGLTEFEPLFRRALELVR